MASTALVTGGGVGIGAAGFSDGMVCAPPDRPQALRSPS